MGEWDENLQLKLVFKDLNLNSVFYFSFSVRRLIYTAPIVPRSLDVFTESPTLYHPPTTLVSETQPTPPPWLPQLSARPTISTNLVKGPSSKSHSKKAKRPEKKLKLHKCHHSECNYATDRRSNLNRHVIGEGITRFF